MDLGSTHDMQEPSSDNHGSETEGKASAESLPASPWDGAGVGGRSCVLSAARRWRYRTRRGHHERHSHTSTLMTPPSGERRYPPPRCMATRVRRCRRLTHAPALAAAFRGAALGLPVGPAPVGASAAYTARGGWPWL
jgi:hypothetical protein